MKWRYAIFRVACIVLVCAVLIPISAVHANTTFQLETEGYIDPGHSFYVRAIQSFDPSKTTGLIGPTVKWNLPHKQNVRGFLWYRFTSNGESWLAPELWPHVSLGPKITLDAEIRYDWALSDKTDDRWQLFTWSLYQLDKKNSLGLFLAHTEILGDGKDQPWFLGPTYAYSIDSSHSVSLTYVQGLEESTGNTLTIDYAFNQ